MSTGSSADVPEPYRFISDLVAVINSNDYPGIEWSDDGTEFKITRGVFDVEGGGMSILCKSPKFGSFIRQLNYYGIKLNTATHHYHRTYLTRDASPEQLALIVREPTGPAAQGAKGGAAKRRRQPRRRSEARYDYDESDPECFGDEYDEEPVERDRRQRGGGHYLQSAQGAGQGHIRNDIAGAVAAVNHAADVEGLQAQLRVLSAEAAATRDAVTATQNTLQVVARLMHRLGGRVDCDFAQVAPGASGIAGITLRARGDRPKPGEAFTLLGEDAFATAVARLGDSVVAAAATAGSGALAAPAAGAAQPVVAQVAPPQQQGRMPAAELQFPQFPLQAQEEQLQQQLASSSLLGIRNAADRDDLLSLSRSSVGMGLQMSV